MTIQTDKSVSSISIEFPQTVKVFARHNIDFCCGGDRSLSSACEARGLDVESILSEIHQELSGPDTPAKRWDQEPVSDLVAHILTTYHEPLREALPRLESMARKVLEVHQDKDPEGLAELLSICLNLRDELEQHMAKEEQILFPMILQGQGAMAECPISVMRMEHDSAGAALAKLRVLTHDYRVPEGACSTWRALWRDLEELETSLHEHIHLENNILFPRALAG